MLYQCGRWAIRPFEVLVGGEKQIERQRGVRFDKLDQVRHRSRRLVSEIFQTFDGMTEDGHGGLIRPAWKRFSIRCGRAVHCLTND